MSGVNVDQRQVVKLQRVLKRIEKTGKKSMFEAIRQTAIFFTQSASKATKPGTKANPSEMAQKHKLRKVITISSRKQKTAGINHYYNMATKKFFVSKSYLTPSRLKAKGWMRVTKFLDAINRKTGKRILLPHNPTKGKPSKKDRRIPKAGAGKAGWIGSRNKLLGKNGKVGDISKNVSALKVRKTGDNPFIQMINNVDYVAKTSPESARIGLKKATNRLRRVSFPRVKKDIEKDIT